MKRILAFILILSALLSLCSCASSGVYAAPTPVPEIDAGAREIMEKLRAKGLESDAEQPAGAAPDVFPLSGKRMSEDRIDAFGIEGYLGRSDIDTTNWESEYGFSKSTSSGSDTYRMDYTDIYYIMCPAPDLSVQLYFNKDKTLDEIIYSSIYYEKSLFEEAVCMTEAAVKTDWGEPDILYSYSAASNYAKEKEFGSLKEMVDEVLSGQDMTDVYYYFAYSKNPVRSGIMFGFNGGWGVAFFFNDL